MRKILIAAVAAIVLVAVAILGAVAMAGQSATTPGHGWARVITGKPAAVAAPAHAQHLVLFARIARDDFTDIAPSGESTGDSVWFEESLWNAARTERVGRDAAECRLGIRTFNCVGTLVLRERGKIQVEAALFGEGNDNVLAITGGTGDFAGVGGQMVVTDISDALDRYDLWIVR